MSRSGGFLRRRWLGMVAVVAVLAVLVFIVWTTVGAIQDGRDRREARRTLVDLATKIDGTTEAIRNATSPDAQRRQAENLSRIIDDLRLSIHCSDLYGTDERPPPCVAVDARLDAIRAGQDPFPPPPTTSTTTPGGSR